MSVALEQLGIERLSDPERIELIGLIWDSITAVDPASPLPDWHSRELERRRQAAEASPEAAIPWEFVEGRLSRA